MKTYRNIIGLEFTVIDRLDRNKVIVQFKESGSVRVADRRNLSAGKIADLHHKARLGVGYLGDYEKTAYHKRALQLWSNMLKRCYDKNDPKGYYGKGVSVEPSWQCYANFLRDLPKLDGFQQWLDKKGYQLDKDLSGNGKVYSKYTCKFIPEFDNKSAGKKGKKLVGGVWVTAPL